MFMEISPRDLAKTMVNGRSMQLLDVRQPWENQLARLSASTLIPLGELPTRLQDLPTDKLTNLVVYCHHGIRSMSAVRYLRSLGYINAQSLAGGIDAWSCEVDPEIPRY